MPVFVANMLKSPADESSMPILPQQDRHHDEEEMLLDDNESDVTKVCSTGLYNKGLHVRERSPSNLSDWSYNSPSSMRTRRRHLTTQAATWFRWATVVSLQTIILIFLWRQNMRREVLGESDAVLKGNVIETGDDINGLYKTTSHSYTYLKPDPETFIPNMTTNDNRMEIRRNWDLLMPLGSGSVALPEYRDHPLLGDPIVDDPIRSGPLFEASWTHALHCVSITCILSYSYPSRAVAYVRHNGQLYYSVDSYHQLIINGRTDDDNPTHSGHCFEYLRNSILCSLDMTLEGSMSTPSDKEKGQPHVCRNREAAVKWIEHRRVDDLQDIVGP